MLARVQFVSFLIGAAFLAAPSFAHDGGHGKAIAGNGPRGGLLAPVIAAGEAELGEKAKTLALLEWKKSGSRIEISFLDQKRKPIPLDAAAELKWILLKKAGAKAEVFSRKGFTQSFESLEQVKAVEVILPRGMLGAEKTVASFLLP